MSGYLKRSEKAEFFFLNGSTLNNDNLLTPVFNAFNQHGKVYDHYVQSENF